MYWHYPFHHYSNPIACDIAIPMSAPIIPQMIGTP
nr:MAG TPA: hypothetical protein [Caudoviricetes sp.]